MTINKTSTLEYWVQRVIPIVYDDSLSFYELLSKVTAYLNDVIEQANGLTDEINNLDIDIKQVAKDLADYKLFVEGSGLQARVEVVLDEWYQTGKLADIINTQVFNMKADKTYADMMLKQHQQELRLQHIGRLTKVALPSLFTWQNAPVQVLFDGKTYKSGTDISTFKNTGGTTYYVSKTGSNTNTGTSETTPFQNISKALSVAINGDTIMLLDGLISRSDLGVSTIVINKSINVIGKTNTIIKAGDTHTFTATAGYPNVWETTRSSALRVVDYTMKYDFVQVSTLAECNSKKGSWYTDGTKVYLHTLDSNQPVDTRHFILINTGTFVSVDGTANHINVYLENVEIVGGTSSIATTNTATYKPSLYMKKCKVLYSCSYTQGGIYAAGCDKALFQNVEVGYSWEDGFDYHLLNGTATKFVEIDCKSYGNGTFNYGTADNFNGSTAHNDCLGIRIGGHYYQNVGPNIADVQGTVQTVNYSVTSFDSASTRGVNFGFQISDNDMWLFGCLVFGSIADLYYPTGGTLYVDDETVYYTEGGAGTKIEI